MTIDIPAGRDRRSSPLGATKSPNQRPSERPADPPPCPPVQWERVGFDRYLVRAGAETIGYIDVVGAVYVVLAGVHYDRAVEVSQTLVLEDALAALQQRADAR
ncbi:MAG TPA: hypothetical protein VFX99_11675 [Microbacterium sp.]|nr:hypothetical protein [Microbacterium sp.]